ncbi:ankyrin repeat-containing domain protein [Tuber brumale]|nr:ankyrin repeat-containing domain protein [Tuber brumale]
MLESNILKWFYWEGRQRLHGWLFRRGDSAVIEILLLCGIDPGKPFKDDYRPLLSRAASMRNPTSVRALLAAPGIHINARYPFYHRETVLIVAVRRRNVNVVAILCRDARTDVSLSGGSRGRTALYYAVGLRCPAVVRCLLERSEIEVDAVNESGETALCIAVGKGDVNMTELLLAEAGAAVPYTKPGASVLRGEARILRRYAAT